jgi:hypothetical protein
MCERLSESTCASQLDLQDMRDVLSFCASSHASMSHLPVACMFEQVRFITGTSGVTSGSISFESAFVLVVSKKVLSFCGIIGR